MTAATGIATLLAAFGWYAWWREMRWRGLPPAELARMAERLATYGVPGATPSASLSECEFAELADALLGPAAVA